VAQKYISFDKNSDAGKALDEWYSWLNNSPGNRAELRRCHSPMDVAFTYGFHRLRQNMAKFGANPERLALVAGVIAHIKNDESQGSFAQQMATPKVVGGPARVTGLRFRRLLRVSDAEKLYPTMIRTTRLLNGSADIKSLANGLYWWNDLTKKRWAYDYYEIAPSED